MNEQKEILLRRSLANSNLKNFTSKSDGKPLKNLQKKKFKFHDANTLDEDFSFTFYVDIASTPIKRLPRSSTPNSRSCNKKIENKPKYQIIHMQFKRLSFTKA
jgi:hypothetical protein